MPCTWSCGLALACPPSPADFVRFFMTVCIGLILGLVYLNQVGGGLHACCARPAQHAGCENGAGRWLIAFLPLSASAGRNQGHHDNRSHVSGTGCSRCQCRSIPACRSHFFAPLPCLTASLASPPPCSVQNVMGLIFVLTVFLGMVSGGSESAAGQSLRTHGESAVGRRKEEDRGAFLCGEDEAECSTRMCCKAPPRSCSIVPLQFNCMTVQPVMAAERTVFYRERSSAMYSPAPYAIVSLVSCGRGGLLPSPPLPLPKLRARDVLTGSSRSAGACLSRRFGLTSRCRPRPLPPAGHRHCGDPVPGGPVPHHGAHLLLVGGAWQGCFNQAGWPHGAVLRAKLADVHCCTASCPAAGWWALSPWPGSSSTLR